MQKYTCVLFDIDNTLVDTDPLIKSSLQVCGCTDVDAVPIIDLRSLSPNKLLNRFGGVESTDTYWQHYRQLAKRDAQLLDNNTAAILESLQERGIRLGIVTSSVKNIASVLLSTCGIYQFFDDCLITFGSCRRRKPSGDPILLALDKLSHPTNGTVYIGDAERDALASQNAGVDFGLACWARLAEAYKQKITSDIELKRIADLLKYT